VLYDALNDNAGWSDSKETFTLEDVNGELSLDSSNSVVEFDFRECTAGTTTVSGNETMQTSVTGPMVTTLPATMNDGVFCEPGLGAVFDNDAISTNNHIELSTFEFGGPMTIEMLLKTDEYSQDTTIIDFGSSGTEAFLFGMSNEMMHLTYNIQDGGAEVDYTVGHLSEKGWDHIVLVVDPGGTWTIWKNGNLVESRAGSVPVHNARDNYGLGMNMAAATSAVGTTRFHGVIGFLNIYKGYVVTATNSQGTHELYKEKFRPSCIESCSSDSAQGTGYDGQPPDQHSWDFRGCSGASVFDDSAGGVGEKIAASFGGGAICTAEGVLLDGVDSYIHLEKSTGGGGFLWGGER